MINYLMRVRAIKDLAQLSPDDFVQAVAEGLKLILQNAENLINDATSLLRNGCDSSSVWLLRGVAEEEAAKVLILVDAVRCPKGHNRFAKHLQNFNDHTAKGIYAEYYNWRPATFGEIISYIDFYRAEYYLDGPEGIEWIFRNKISQDREEIIYVDYVEDEDGHRWQLPNPEKMRGGKMRSSELVRGALAVSRGLKAIGCTTTKALSLLADFWKDIEMNESFHWQDLRRLNDTFFLKMKAEGLLREDPRFLIDHWLFPVYSLDLSLKKVDKLELRAIQERWNPGYRE